MKITAVILTYNEELHLSRCIESLKGIVANVVVVDSFSTDKTLDIAVEHGATIIQHQWLNYSSQFNWALSILDPSTDWVLRIDADEILTLSLRLEIKSRMNSLESNIHGVYWGRRIVFLGKAIKYGGVFPIQVLRLFRFGHGKCENRWMDEHIKVNGMTTNFNGEMLDNNLNSLTWWTDKHNKYASREAVDLLNLDYGFIERDLLANISTGQQPAIKRWIKEKVYFRCPTGYRAFVYFFYRYIIRLGFLDGSQGLAFHFLQGFWYRYLVDIKVEEVKRSMNKNKISIQKAIKEVLDIRL